MSVFCVETSLREVEFIKIFVPCHGIFFFSILTLQQDQQQQQRVPYIFYINNTNAKIIRNLLINLYQCQPHP